MLKYKLDTISKQEGIYVVYIHIMDGEKIVTTECLTYNNKKDFKEKLKLKLNKVKTEYDERETKKAEIEQALSELEAE